MILEVILTIAEDDCHLQICDVRQAESINFESHLLETNSIPNDYISSDILKTDCICKLHGLYVPHIEEVDINECTCRGFINVDDSVVISELVGKII